MKTRSLKRLHFLLMIFLSFTISIRAQKADVYIEDQVVKLILRLDTLKGNVVYDYALNADIAKSSYAQEHLLDYHKREKILIDKNRMQKVAFNRIAIEKKILLRNTIKEFEPTDRKLKRSNCVYNDTIFGAQMDSLSVLISKNYKDDKSVDSLSRIQQEALNSVINGLSDYRCNKVLLKQFVLEEIYEGKGFYLILYGIKYEDVLEMYFYSEIVFKPVSN